MSDEGKETLAAFASAIANADEVRPTPAPGAPASCMLCRREVGLAVIVILKGLSIGRSDQVARPLVGVCSECRDAAGDDRRAGVLELARAAVRADALLMLIRHGAECQLAPWWGAVGSCRPEEIDAASVEVRRAIERLGIHA